MVKEKYSTTEFKKIIKDLVSILIENKITVDKIILYGSYANGQAGKHSDIDIAVISPHFNGKKIIDIQGVLARTLSKYLAVVEPVGYSSEDYYSAEQRMMLSEIKRTGKVLYST